MDNLIDLAKKVNISDPAVQLSVGAVGLYLLWKNKFLLVGTIGGFIGGYCWAKSGKSIPLNLGGTCCSRCAIGKPCVG